MCQILYRIVKILSSPTKVVDKMLLKRVADLISGVWMVGWARRGLEVRGQKSEVRSQRSEVTRDGEVIRYSLIVIRVFPLKTLSQFRSEIIEP